MKVYITKDGREFNSVYELRRGLENVVFPSEVTDEVLGLLEVKVEERLDPAPSKEELAERARWKRTRLLQESDYLLLSDYPALSKKEQNALCEYRQMLRDIPQQKEFPEDIVWPTKPSFV